jgi:hypothetical protein
MKMIGHQAIRMNLPACPPAGAFQNLEKQLSICIVSNNGFSPVASAQHMIEGARILNSQWSSHEPEPDRNGELCQYLALTPCVSFALLRAGFDNCVFMWAPFGFDPLPTVRQIRATPD